MNTSASATFTPLESLFLLRGILSKGLSTAAFAHVSHVLSNNSFVKEAPTYDARRLTPEALKSFFLHLLWEQLKVENEATQAPVRPDGAVSPATKKRRLQAVRVPTLKEARHHHLDKVVSIANRLEAEYRDYAVRSIRDDEARFEKLQSEIAELERDDQEKAAAAAEAAQANQVDKTAAPKEPQAGKPPTAGSQLSPAAPTRQQGGKNAAPSPQPSSANPPVTPVPVPVLAPQQPVQPAQPAVPPAAPTTPARQLESSKPPAGGPVLQAPQGLPPFPPAHPTTPAPPAAATGAPRPDTAGRPKQTTPVPPPGQIPPPAGQSQLSWQPPYQPPRAPVPQPGQRPLQPSPVPQRAQPIPPQHRPQVPPQQAKQPQQGTQLPQPVLVPAQSSAAHIPIQTAAARTASEVTTTPAKNAPHPAAPTPEPSRVPPTAPQLPAASDTNSRPGAQLPAPKQPQATPSHAAPDRPPAPKAPVMPAASAAPQNPNAQKLYNSPQATLPPRPAIPPHLQQGPTSRLAQQANRAQPSTPARQASSLMVFTSGGSGTKWKSNPTPSTPRPSPGGGAGTLESPTIEPLSPTRTAMSLPPSAARAASTTASPEQPPPAEVATTPAPKRRGRPPRGAQAALTSSSPPTKDKDVAKETHEPPDVVMKGADGLKIKHEDSTPRPPTEAGDTTADESVVGKRHPSRLSKRKRRDSTPMSVQTPVPEATPSLEDLPALPPTEVLWTRAFNKVSGSAMEQIVHHRSANMFAHPIREKDAPGYSKVILRPQDLKSIRAAINHGNKAASQAAAALPGGDPGTSTVRLPISEELVPPRGIINSSQLDRELAHMFSNAIMYNPDPFHGPGPTFLRRDDEDDPDAADGAAGENALGYKVDEFGVVKDARAMFVEVEKLVSELRSAEIQRSRPALTTGTNTRHASVAAGGNGDVSAPQEEEASAAEDADEQTVIEEQTATEAESVSNPSKRRRRN